MQRLHGVDAALRSGGQDPPQPAAGLSAPTGAAEAGVGDLLSSVLESSGDCIKILDLDGRLLFMSEAGRRLMGVERFADIAGCAWLDFWADEANIEAHAAVLAARRGGTGRFRAACPTLAGTPRWWDVQVSPIFGRSGEPAKLLSISRDITESRQAELALKALNETLEGEVLQRTGELMAAEASLRQSQKMQAIGQLTGGIAHDFNNMLQAISSSLELLQIRMAQGRTEDAERHLGDVRKTVERAGGLTNRLLASARQQVLEPRTVDANQLLDDVGDLIRRAVGPGVAVVLRPSPDIPGVLCDPGQIENVLLNLAINARDAMPEGGVLTIATETVSLGDDAVADQEGALPGDYVGIVVSDTGIGMTRQVIERAFEPFFTTKPLGRGTGLGLSQLHGFIRQSKGVVRLESVPGQGTTIRLYLPSQVAIATDQHDAVRVDPETMRGVVQTLLLVEDEQQLREPVVEALQDLGYQVLEASGAEAARLAMQNAARLDLLVTDLGLPGAVDGRQVAALARLARPDLPVLFMTGATDGVLEAQLPAGTALLCKPFRLATLATKVHALLEHQRSGNV